MATLKEKIGYGLGDMSSSMFWKLFSYYLPFFYSNVFGLGLGDAGTLLLITRLYDAVSDPVMGMIADRTESKWGKYRPWLLWGAIPFAVAGVLTFTAPEGDYAFKKVYAYASYLLMMTLYTLVNVPYGAMLGTVTSDSGEKTVFSSFRMFFAYAGSFIALAVFEPLRDFFVLRGVAWSHSWQYATAVIGVFCAILFILCFSLTKERVKVAADRTEGSVGKDLKALVSNGPWWLLLGAAIGSLLFTSIRGGAAAYYFKDFLGGNALYTSGVFLAVGEVANMAGVILAVPMAARLGKKSSCIYVLASTAILSGVSFFVSDSPAGQWTLLVLQTLIGVASGVVLPLVWSMFADIADYSEYRNGKASTGLIFSSSTMAQKFGGAFGSALILWLLASFGYDTSEKAVQASEALYGLRAMISIIPAGGALAALIAVVLYPLNDKRMQEISAVLLSRRES